MKSHIWLVSTLAAVTLCGCNAMVGTGGVVSVPKDAARTCAEHCGEIGMSLDSVVIMANNVGCVCRGARSASVEGGSTAGGMAALVVAAEQARQQQQQRQQ